MTAICPIGHWSMHVHCLFKTVCCVSSRQEAICSSKTIGNGLVLNAKSTQLYLLQKQRQGCSLHVMQAHVLLLPATAKSNSTKDAFQLTTELHFTALVPDADRELLYIPCCRKSCVLANFLLKAYSAVVLESLLSTVSAHAVCLSSTPECLSFKLSPTHIMTNNAGS